MGLRFVTSEDKTKIERCTFYDYMSFFHCTHNLEKLHPKAIRWTENERKEYLQSKYCHGIWILTPNDNIVAEILWRNDSDDTFVYVDSFTVAKKYQGKGYGSLIMFYLYNLLKNLKFTEVRGHAKIGSSWHIINKLGAKPIEVKANHEGTGERYIYYKHKL
jgi:GNAT superfamily N-acetyltransferase